MIRVAVTLALSVVFWSQTYRLVLVTDDSTGWVVGPSPVTLPDVYVDISYTLPTGCTEIDVGVTPTGGCKIITVDSGQNLQTALNDVRHGDIVQTECNSTFTGSFNLPAKTGAGIVYWTSSCRAELPIANNRVNPDLGGTCGAIGALPCGITANMSTTEFPHIVGAGTTPHYVLEAAVETDTGWRIQGQEFRSATGVQTSSLMRTVPLSGGESDHAYNIILDRNWIHGDCSAANGNINGSLVLVSGQYHAVTYNYIDCAFKTDSESKGVLCVSLCDTFAVIGNLIQSSGIEIYADMTTDTVNPQDVEIRWNFLTKPIAINEDADFVTNKNCFEVKSGIRILFEANLCSNVWKEAQETAINIKIGDELDNKYTEDITIRMNWIKDSANAIKLCMQDCNTPPSLVGRDYAAYNNIFDNINGASFGGTNEGDGIGFYHLVAGNGIMVVSHNTMVTMGPCVGLTAAAASTNYSGLDFSDNICGAPVDFMRFTTADANASWPGGYAYTRNLIVDTTCANYPSGNQCPATWAAIGFENYNSGNGGDYELDSGSTYKGDGQDTYDVGTTDPGANVPVVTNAVSCALTGQCASWTPAPAPRPMPFASMLKRR